MTGGPENLQWGQTDVYSDKGQCPDRLEDSRRVEEVRYRGTDETPSSSIPGTTSSRTRNRSLVGPKLEGGGPVKGDTWGPV